jgi:hypothetical protein
MAAKVEAAVPCLLNELTIDVLATDLGDDSLVVDLLRYNCGGKASTQWPLTLAETFVSIEETFVVDHRCAQPTARTQSCSISIARHEKKRHEEVNA